MLVLEIAFLNYLYYTKLLKVGVDPSEVSNAEVENDFTES